MTISTTGSRISYNGNGVTTAFSFPYFFFANGDLVVSLVNATTGVETAQVLNTDYTVTGAGVGAGGTVTMTVAPASGYRLVVYRDTAITQDTDYISGDAFPAETHERALDKLTVIAQEREDELDRSLKVPASDPTTLDMTIPTDVDRKGKFLAFDASTGEPVASGGTVGGAASVITYSPDGTGAVPTTVQAKLRLAVHVADFGATGVGDKRAEIQAAIDAVAAAGGGDVFFSSIEYTVGSRLYWKSGVFLRSTYKTIIKVVAGVDSPVIGIVDQQTTPAITNIGAYGIAFDGNAVNSPGVTASSAVILDPVDGAYFQQCEFRNARGYGASLQYPVTGIPDNSRIKNIVFDTCDFHGNGIGTATPGTLYDGIDVKNCDGLRFVACRAYNNSEDGFDFRGENIDLIACEAYANGNSGLEVSANSNGNNQDTSVRIVGGQYWGNGQGITVANNPAGGTGATRASFSAVHVRDNTGVGISFLASNANTYAIFDVPMVFGNGGRGVEVLGAAKQIVLNGPSITGNTGDGLYCNAALTLQVNGGLIADNGGWGYLEGASAARNNLAGAMRVAGNTSGQISINAAARLTKVDTSVLDYTPNGSAPSDVIASAATITLPEGGGVFYVTGTTNITSITASTRGRVVVLQFSGVLTVTDGGNLLLNGNYTTSSADTLTLACDGTNWTEIARSAN